MPPLDLLQRIEVIGAAGDRLFEDRRVGCGAAKPVFNDQAMELAARKKTATQIVQPDRLTEFLQLFEPLRTVLACFTLAAALPSVSGDIGDRL
jgi:hypothetical protein